MAFEPIDGRRSLVEMVVDQVYTYLATGELKPGDIMPVESKLAKTFNIGTSTIREAMRILKAQGIVDFLPRKGS